MDAAEKQTWATAYHEAGHAVVATLLGREVKTVTIKPEGDDNGQTVWTEKTEDEIRNLMKRGFVDLYMMIISFAGPIAEARFDTDNPVGALKDHGSARNFAHCTWPHGEQTGREYEPDCLAARRALDGAREQALAEVTSHWGIIEDVARRLFDDKTLTGEQVANLVAAHVSNSVPPELAC